MPILCARLIGRLAITLAAVSGLFAGSSFAQSDVPRMGTQPAQQSNSGKSSESSPKSQSPVGSLFATTRPDLMIVVRRHASGSDIVDVTTQNGDYPEALLLKQAAALGSYLGSPPSGTRVFPHQIGDDDRFRFMKATFAVRGLIDREAGVFHVEPIVRAFAGAPAPNTNHILMIQFEGERPSTNTLRSYYPDSGDVKLEAVASPNALGVEYRIQLLTQDPNRIHIPDDRRVPVVESPKLSPPNQGKGLDLISVVALVAAALGGGALVYSLLVRTRSRRV